MKLGVDLGGSKIEIIVMSDEGSLLLRRRIPTPQNDYDAVLQAIISLIFSVEQDISPFSSNSLDGIVTAVRTSSTPMSGWVHLRI